MAMKTFGLLAFVYALSAALCQPHLASGAAEDGAEALLSQAGVSFAKGNREDAIELATKAIEADPKNARAYYVRGRFYAEVRQPQKAVKYAKQAVYVDPYDDAAHELLAQLYEKTGNESGLSREKRVLNVLGEWRALRRHVRSFSPQMDPKRLAHANSAGSLRASILRQATPAAAQAGPTRRRLRHQHPDGPH